MEQSFKNKSWKQNSYKNNKKNFGPKKNNIKNRDNANKHQRFPAAPEEPTPWSKLRDELFEKQQMDKVEESPSDSETKKKVMQEKEENHRKFMIEKKQKEEVKWEDFSNNVELSGAATNAFRRAPINLPKIGKNFDNRNLTVLQQAQIKNVITKCAFKKTEGRTKNLKQVLVDLKRYGPIHNKKFK